MEHTILCVYLSKDIPLKQKLEKLTLLLLHRKLSGIKIKLLLQMVLGMKPTIASLQLEMVSKMP
jgi:hypothetical protein